MLRSTGFFRGIDCPFYKEYTDAKGDKNGCNRPYCHFRHSKQRRASYGTTLDIRKQRELDSKQKEQAYDPFNPEVVPYQEQKDGEPSGSGDITGALELVNKAIEEVQSEVEREKRKLSRIGDEEYDPISNLSLSTVDAIKRPSPAAFSSHLAYDPGSYQMTSSEYNPTPCCSKYTLDSDIQGSTVNSMEYVPTLMRKPAPRTHKTQHPSPPPTPIYSNNSSSSKFKYILDNSKPSTDMEYDPLSNYSAKITGKHKKEEGVKATHVDANKVSKQAKTGRSSADEEYVPTAKKSEQSKETQKYTFSDTEEESSGTEYRPTSLNRLQKKANSVLVEDAIGTLRKYGIKRPASSLTQRSREELKEGGATVGISDVLERRKSNAENETLAAKLKNSKSDKVPKVEKEAIKVAGSKVSSSNNRSKEKGSAKKSTCDSSKKDGQSQRKKDVKSKEKESGNKLPKGLKEEKKNDGKSKLVERLKSESGKRDKSRENGAGENKKLKMSDKEKEHGKHKDHQHKNGKHEGSKRENDISKNSKHSSNSSSKGSGNSSNTISKSSSVSNKVSMKRKRAPLEGNRVKDKRRTPSLSHADLFGDESPEEAEAMAEDDEEDMEEVLVRKSANALKRRHVKKQVPQPTPSSSEGEDNFGMEDDAAARDEIDYCGVDLSILQDDMDFDSDPMEECLRIFNESKDVKKEDKGRQAKQPSRDSEEDEGTESTLTTLFPGQKKRVSHFAVKGNTDAHPKTVVRPYRRQSAQEICYQRLQIAQQQAAQLAAAVKTATASPGPNFPGERRRIAHRPNPAVPSSTKPACSAESRVLSPNRTPAAHVSIRAQTSAGILSKTSSTVVQKRLAHTPTMKSTSMKRPVIPMEFGAKVPTNIRQRYLTTFIDECVKFCPSEDVAFQMALDEEKVVYERSSSKNIYLNVAVNTLKKLRSKSCPSVAAVPRAAGSVPNRRAQSHKEVLGGRLAATTSFTINRMGKQQEEKPIGATLYRKLRAYLMTEEQLQEHGYPRAVPESSGRAVIYNLPEKKAPADPFTKICCRCGAEYKINVNGNCVRKEECNNHWGRLRRHKVSGGWETNYNCCSGAVGSLGCQVCKQHVQDGRKESLDGYVKTFSKALPPDGNGGVYALDCEMCYTKLGLELTRVTVINAELKVIYDTFVKPDSKVVDYNTRFSGVTEDDLDSTTITLRDVQAVLLNMFSAESILIGHSLESDLLALKLIHSTVIDTAIVFPHRLGLPYKRALRNLMADHLKRIIQDNVEGHDSSEDASACMELIIWKLKEDAKVKR